jgi:uncharacterized repeat protein (TIGR01451 family)
VVAWGVWGGFQLEFSRFFAAEPPTDPSGACVWKTNFNAPDGAWFCNSLQCNLNGNPAGDQQFPPAGPATRLRVKVFRTIEAPVNPADGPIHIRTVLDATPQCANGKECYPPKDPLWTCTGPMYQGRDGSDFYDCYNPIIHRTDYGPITCCANTGLAGDCFTWDLAAPPGATVSPVMSPTASPAVPPTASPVASGTVTPGPSVNPVSCSPATQTVSVRQAATLQASGGTGTYQWVSEGQVKSGQAVSFTYDATGTKIITVTSGAATASCLATVTAASPTASPAASPVASPVAVDLTLHVVGRNASTGGAEASSVTAVGGNHIEAILRLLNPSTTTSVQNVMARASLPGGLTYVSGSTSINGVPTSLETITTSGLALGTVGAGEEATVTFRILVSSTAFPVGTSQAVIAVTAGADGIPARSGQLTVVVTRQVAGPGETPTGPGDAALVALLVSAIATLLYVSYTNSSAFRRHELERIGRERDPLDFKK